jgi:protocatechuate 3,4-dioxygenase beta subunit
MVTNQGYPQRPARLLRAAQQTIVAISALACSAVALANISGVAYQDFNNNGIQDTAGTIPNAGAGAGTTGTAVDKGLAGVQVTAVCVTNAGADGIVGTADDTLTTFGPVTTGATGAYSLPVTGALSPAAPKKGCRVAFAWDAASAYTDAPTNTQLNPLFGMKESQTGGTAKTRTQFANDAETTIDLPLNYPAEFCQNNPTLATPCYIEGASNGTFAADPVLVTFPYSSKGTGNNSNLFTNLPAPAKVAKASDIGATWGVSYHKPTTSILTSAYYKRHTGTVGGALSTIYKSAPGADGIFGTADDTNAALVSIDAITVTPAGTPSAGGVDPRTTVGYNYIVDAASTTAGGATSTLVGKRGLGDLDISDDGQTLYTIGLNSRKLYAMPITDALAAPTTATAIDLPDPGTGATGCPRPAAQAATEYNDNLRPFALKTYKGAVYVGITCTGEFAPATVADLRAFVYKYDGATFKQVVSYKIDATIASPNVRQGFNWQAWNNNAGGGQVPQPILTDIEFNGDEIILGVRDRHGDITGFGTQDPTDSFREDGRGHGETYRLCKSASAEFYAESASCSAFKYNDNFNLAAADAPNTGPTDPNGSMGGLAQIPGFPNLVQTTKDPIAIYAAGASWFDNATGIATKGYELYPGIGGNRFDSSTSSFGKASGLGDLEALCNAAPVEIGNRIWLDANNNGIQDPGEAPIAGVTVRLLDSLSNVIATAVTDANGNYIFSGDKRGYPATGNDGTTTGGFSAADVQGGTASTASARYGVMLMPGQNYSITLNNPADYAAGGPLANVNLSPALAGANREIDSNATLATPGSPIGAGNYPTMAVTGATDIPAAGANNHSFDVGFTPIVPISLGNMIFYDTNNNGLMDAGEAAIPGVRVELFADANTDGVPDSATPVAVAFTDANGKYLFTQKTDSAGAALATPLPLTAGSFVVGVAPSNFAAGGALAGTLSSGTTRNADGTLSEAAAVGGNSDTNNADHGEKVTSGTFTNYVLSKTVTVTAGGEPTNDQPTANDVAGSFGGNPIADANSNLSIDFGFYGMGLGSTVFKDDGAGGGTLNNGKRDNTSEAAIVGAKVILYAADGTTKLAETTTDANGQYYFAGLAAGSYIVAIDTSTLMAGMNGSSGTDVPNTENGDSGVTVTATEIRSGTVVLTPGAAPTAEASAGTPSTTADQTTRTVSGFGTGLTPNGANGAGIVNKDNALTPDNNSNLAVDFGIIPTAVSVGNFVWLDLNSNGIQDASEPGILGVVATISNAAGGPVKDAAGNTLTAAQLTTTTDANGLYSFTNLAPGQYIVTFTQPAGYTLSPSTQGTDTTKDSNGLVATSAVLTGGQSDPTLDLGLIPQGVSVGNFVWSDTNGNGIQDPSEPGILGVVATITNKAGGPVKDALGNTLTAAQLTTTTDANGLYSFTNLAPGQYTVTFTQPAGYTVSPSTQGTDTTKDSNGLMAMSAVLTGGQSDLSLDLGLIPQGVSVGNFVWSDTNANGIQDASEPGVMGVVATISNAAGGPVKDAAGNTLTAAQLTTTTDANGLYSFTNLAPGQYIVTFTQPAGYTLSPSTQGTDTTKDSNGLVATSAVLTGGQSDPTLDLGLIPQGVSVGNFVWSDTNGNGIQDPGEPGVPGVVATITNKAGGPVLSATGTPLTAAQLTTTTDANGLYSFTNLAPGQYTITFTQPAGYTLSPSTQGTDTTKDSNGLMAMSAVLTAGQSDTTLDLGLVPAGGFAIGNRVFLDANNNGAQDAGELGIPGVTVNLLNSAGAQVATITTDANGYYLFKDLTAGTYTVEIPASNFTGTGPLVSRTSSGPTIAPLGNMAVVVDISRDTGINVSNPAMIGVKSAPVTVGTGLQPQGESDLSAAGQGNADANANMTVDFGFIPAVKLGNLVWIDDGSGGGTPKDGQQNGTEPGINGVTVTVRDGAGNVIGSAVTQNNPVTGRPGWYEFTLAPGSYQVEFSPPPGYVFTSQSTPAAPGNSATDTNNSQPTAANPRTIVVALTAAGQQNLQLDAGFVAADPGVATGVPTMSEWMLMLLSLLTFSLGARRVHTLRRTQR